MSNLSQEEESQGSIHQQPLHGSHACAHTMASGEAVASTTAKRRRSLPGNPDPDAEVIALSPRSLLATNRYVCEVCHKGFQRDQNLQLHRRGHNLPWKLKQRATTEARKRVYVCPEASCVHHHPSRALGDLTGIKKHFSRKHGEKKWKCDKCSKRYAVQSDWKAHSKICGTKEYRCDCRTVFSREDILSLFSQIKWKDSFITHRAFCDALVEQGYRENHALPAAVANEPAAISCADTDTMASSSFSYQGTRDPLRPLSLSSFAPSSSSSGYASNILRACSVGPGGLTMGCFGSESHHAAAGSACMSATALLQKAAEMGAKVSDDSISHILFRGFSGHHHLSVSGASPLVDASSASSVPAAVTMNSDSTFQQRGNGVVNSPLALHPVNKSPASTFTSSQQGVQGNLQEEAACGTRGRTTQDFLGLGPVGGLAKDGQSCHGSAEGLGFPDGQQKEDGMHFYHHHHHHNHLGLEECHQAAMDRPMWNY